MFILKYVRYRMAQMLKRSFSMSATALSGLVKAPVAVSFSTLENQVVYIKRDGILDMV